MGVFREVAVLVMERASGYAFDRDGRWTRVRTSAVLDEIERALEEVVRCSEQARMYEEVGDG